MRPFSESENSQARTLLGNCPSISVRAVGFASSRPDARCCVSNCSFSVDSLAGAGDHRGDGSWSTTRLLSVASLCSQGRSVTWSRLGALMTPAFDWRQFFRGCKPLKAERRGVFRSPHLVFGLLPFLSVRPYKGRRHVRTHRGRVE